MSEKLKPCPFCKKKSKVNVHTIFFLHGPLQYSVSCEKCGTCGGMGKTKQEAVEAWNRRAGE